MGGRRHREDASTADPRVATERRRRLLAGAAATAAVAAVAAYLGVWGRRYGVDLEVYRAGVKEWFGGHTPYGPHYTRYGLPYTYPPFSLVAFAPLALLPFALTQAGWWFVSFAALGASVAVAARAGGFRWDATTAGATVGWAALSVLVVEPVRSTFDYGQVNAVLMLVVLVDVLALPRRRRGWLVGVAAAVKLTPVVFLALFVVDRDVKAAVRGAATFVGLTGATWLLWPSISTHYWAHQVGSPGVIGSVGSASNQSLYGILHRPPFAAAGVPVLWLAASALVLALGLLVARRCLGKGQRLEAVVAVALSGLLVSPVSWSHHWIWVVLVPVALVRPLAAGAPLPVRGAMAVVLALAVVAPYWWFATGAAADACIDLMPLWSVALLVLWAASGRGRRGPTTAAAALASAHRA